MCTHMSWGHLITRTIPSLSQPPAAQAVLTDPLNMQPKTSSYRQVAYLERRGPYLHPCR